jgi:hypothetical protein
MLAKHPVQFMNAKGVTRSIAAAAIVFVNCQATNVSILKGCKMLSSASEWIQAINMTCSICLEDQMTDPIILPNCKHAFCRQCLREWHAFEKFKKETTCPTCCSILLNDQSEENPIDRARIYGLKHVSIPTIQNKN